MLCIVFAHSRCTRSQQMTTSQSMWKFNVDTDCEFDVELKSLRRTHCFKLENRFTQCSNVILKQRLYFCLENVSHSVQEHLKQAITPVSTWKMEESK